MDIVTIGEVLIDLTQTGGDERGIPQFAANPAAPPPIGGCRRPAGHTDYLYRQGGRGCLWPLSDRGFAGKQGETPAIWSPMPTTLPPWQSCRWMPPGERDFSFYRRVPTLM